MCYGNLGTVATGAVTLTATLSTSPTTMGTIPFGSLGLPGGHNQPYRWLPADDQLGTFGHSN
jgi:hypothetical protein